MAINCGSLSHPLLCPGVTWRVAGVINPDVSAAPGLATLSNGAAVISCSTHTHCTCMSADIRVVRILKAVLEMSPIRLESVSAHS